MFIISRSSGDIVGGSGHLLALLEGLIVEASWQK